MKSTFREKQEMKFAKAPTFTSEASEEDLKKLETLTGENTQLKKEIAETQELYNSALSDNAQCSEIIQGLSDENKALKDKIQALEAQLASANTQPELKPEIQPDIKPEIQPDIKSQDKKPKRS